MGIRYWCTVCERWRDSDNQLSGWRMGCEVCCSDPKNVPRSIKLQELFDKIGKEVK